MHQVVLRPAGPLGRQPLVVADGRCQVALGLDVGGGRPPTVNFLRVGRLRRDAQGRRGGIGGHERGHGVRAGAVASADLPVLGGKRIKPAGDGEKVFLRVDRVARVVRETDVDVGGVPLAGDRPRPGRHLFQEDCPFQGIGGQVVNLLAEITGVRCHRFGGVEVVYVVRRGRTARFAGTPHAGRDTRVGDAGDARHVPAIGRVPHAIQQRLVADGISVAVLVALHPVVGRNGVQAAVRGQHEGIGGGGERLGGMRGCRFPAVPA